MARKPYTMLIIDAVGGSALPPDMRHLLIRMAYEANSRTGAGWKGQETLAALMGCTSRHVRAMMATLSAPDAAPVRLERTPRFRADGRGRTSDSWRLVLADQPERGSGKSPGLTGTPRTTNRNATPDQPERGSGDPLSDPRSGPRSSSASASEAGSFALSSPSKKQAAKRKPPKKTKPADPDQGAKHARVVAHYHELFERKRGVKPPFDGADGTAVKNLLKKLDGDADRACAAIAGAFADDWWAQRATIRSIATDPAKFLNAQQRKTNGRTPTQRNHPGTKIEMEEYT